MTETLFHKPQIINVGFESRLDTAREESIGFMLGKLAKINPDLPINAQHQSISDLLTANRLYEQEFKHHVRIHLPDLIAHRRETRPTISLPRCLGALTLEMVSSEFLERATIIGQVLGDDALLETLAMRSTEEGVILGKSRTGWSEMFTEADRNDNDLMGELGSGIAYAAVARRVQDEPGLIARGLSIAA